MTPNKEKRPSEEDPLGLLSIATQSGIAVAGHGLFIRDDDWQHVQ